MYLERVLVMRAELHKDCNNARPLLHKSWSDSLLLDRYCFSMNTKEEAGRRIRDARTRLKLRLEDVCANIPEITVSRLSNWEQGRNMIGVDEAKKIAPILKVSAAYLLTLEDSQLDERESALLTLYRQTDPRGRDAILHVAERESAYLIESQDLQDSATGT